MKFAQTLLAAVLATAVAGVMRGYSGFGTAVILAPVYSLLWGPRAGVPVMLLMELVISVQLLPSAMKEADRRVVLPLGGAAALATPLGAWILFTVDGEALRRFIGGFVLIFGLLLMSGWRYHRGSFHGGSADGQSLQSPGGPCGRA